MKPSISLRLSALWLPALWLASVACTEAKAPVVPRDAKAEQFFKRAEQDFGAAQVDDAHDAIERALAIAPQDQEIKTLGGRIALARLEFDESLRLLNEVPGSEARGLRGRAFWYRGDLSPAADEFEAMLDDPSVRDDWAKSVAGLARQGNGRKPFSLSGSPRAAVEMAQVSDLAPYLVVPVEIDGEDSLALVATGMNEVVVDRAAHAEPAWISMRFRGSPPIGGGEASVVDVEDVPALTQDLTGVAREVNAPIRALIGVNLLRHLNATVDYSGHQFVVRQEAAPPPPNATRVNLFYSRGGGMIVGSQLSAGGDGRATLFVDSTARFPLALDERGWIKAGVSPNELATIPGEQRKLKEGMVPSLRLGAFELKKIPGVLGPQVGEIESGLAFDVDGIMGVPVLAMYRLTFGEGGRVVYLEDDTELRRMLEDLDGRGAPPAGPINDAQPPIPIGPGLSPVVPGGPDR